MLELWSVPRSQWPYKFRNTRKTETSQWCSMYVSHSRQNKYKHSLVKNSTIYQNHSSDWSIWLVMCRLYGRVAAEVVVWYWNTLGDWKQPMKSEEIGLVLFSTRECFYAGRQMGSTIELVESTFIHFQQKHIKLCIHSRTCSENLFFMNFRATRGEWRTNCASSYVKIVGKIGKSSCEHGR